MLVWVGAEQLQGGTLFERVLRSRLLLLLIALSALFVMLIEGRALISG
jgi:hypothetical protein